MKYLITTLVLFLVVSFAFAQKKLPDAALDKLDGNTVELQQLAGNGNPVIVCFWATWCKPCVFQLNTIEKIYADWQEKYKVELIAISVDDPRNTEKVAPFVSNHNWDYLILRDPKSEVAASMKVANMPHLFILDDEGRIVWESNSFAPGDEQELENQLEKIVND